MKGMSALIGTILIIGFTLVIAALIFTFSENSLEEKISSVSDSEIESYCLLHVTLEETDACFSDDTVSLTLQNRGDATITSDSAFRFTNGESTCLIPLFLPIEKGLLPFETRAFNVDIDGCGFTPTTGEIIPFVDLNEGSYSCGVEESFEIEGC